MSFERTAVLVLVVLLAGCSSGGANISSPSDASPSEPAATPSETTSTAPTTTSETAETPTETVVTTESSWTAPSGPSSRWGTQVKTENQSERFMAVHFVNKRESGDGYSDFDLEVFADTRMPDVDPNNDPGEPYYLVKINGVLVAKTDEVGLEEHSATEIQIPRAALDQFDAGTLRVKVTMMEHDQKYDDKYRTWTGSIKYRPAN